MVRCSKPDPAAVPGEWPEPKAGPIPPDTFIHRVSCEYTPAILRVVFQASNWTKVQFERRAAVGYNHQYTDATINCFARASNQNGAAYREGICDGSIY